MRLIRRFCELQNHNPCIACLWVISAPRIVIRYTVKNNGRNNNLAVKVMIIADGDCNRTVWCFRVTPRTDFFGKAFDTALTKSPLTSGRLQHALNRTVLVNRDIVERS